MADDITLGEVGRRIDALSMEVRQLVSRSEVDIRFTAVQKDVAELEARLAVAESRRWQAGLAVVFSVLVPLILAYLQSGR
ncbi:hypothetical protein [Cryptosporangium sp. NPDC051539]|uniref:hypothetical protein n=1 Tax=Cryptosporangium sp. NPDC051539 TaxID=3363962 RepID=UPI0037B7C039